MKINPVAAAAGFPPSDSNGEDSMTTGICISMSTIRPFEQKHNAAISHGGVNTDM
jgi:hypothetical protein